jgi:hypothetical protein
MDRYYKNRMWTGALGIHICISDWPIFISDPHTVVHFGFFSHVGLCHILDVDTPYFILSNFKISFRSVK